jgi:hypothetical protein
VIALMRFSVASAHVVALMRDGPGYAIVLEACMRARGAIDEQIVGRFLAWMSGQLKRQA